VWDVGARYRINKSVVLRLNVENVQEKYPWRPSSGGTIYRNTPRNATLSATFDF
jgi:outer membrane receptor protein involved in Fe transport